MVFVHRQYFPNQIAYAVLKNQKVHIFCFILRAKESFPKSLSSSKVDKTCHLSFPKKIGRDSCSLTVARALTF